MIPYSEKTMCSVAQAIKYILDIYRDFLILLLLLLLLNVTCNLLLPKDLRHWILENEEI